MKQILESIRNEFNQEAAITKRVLDKVPADKLAWKPHAKSMSLGQLAIHLAGVPGRLAMTLQKDQFEVTPDAFEPTPPKNIEEIQATFEQSIKAAEEYLKGLNEASASGEWSLIVNGKKAVSMPRIAVVRSIMMNHCYHHRGQLSVYLRLLDVPLPVIYGRSADESPFG